MPAVEGAAGDALVTPPSLSQALGSEEPELAPLKELTISLEAGLGWRGMR